MSKSSFYYIFIETINTNNMTRINCGIPVRELTDKHLLAEHREIKRIPNQVRKGNINLSDQPDHFKLGTGHVKFFYDKCGYLLKRYVLIYSECISRGFNVTNYCDAWRGIPDQYMRDYTPTDHDRAIVRERIAERLKK